MNFDINKIQQTLVLQLAKSMEEVKNESKETEELKRLLKKSTDDFPEMLDSKMCKFLMSLFSILTTDEQDMLIQILRNPKSLSVFLQKLKFMPNDNTLLDNIRMELRTLAPQMRLEMLGITNTIPPENLSKQNEKV